MIIIIMQTTVKYFFFFFKIPPQLQKVLHKIVAQPIQQNV